MANLDAQGGYRLLFLEKHLNMALKERVHWCINLFLSGVLWYNSGEVQEGRNGSHGPAEETNGSILLISWVSLRNINYDLEHLCRNLERYHLHPKHNFTNVKKGKIQESYWLPKTTFSTSKPRMLFTYFQSSPGRNCSASFSFNFSYARSQLANKINW